MSEDDTADRATTATDLQFILQETRLVLLQQILAHETGALSTEELIYRNPDLSEENVRYHLRELEESGIVEGLEIPPGQRHRDFPNTFFAVTETGISLLKQANLYDEIDVWQQVYAALERTERIEAIEQLEDRPRADHAEQHEANGPGEESDIVSTEAGDDPVVLVVDDEPELTEVYGSWLNDRYAVRRATSGDDALEQLDSAVDIVLLDRRMPDCSGDELLEELRARGYDGPVAMLTAVEPDFDIIEMAIDDYLVKPVTQSEILETVDRLVNRSTLDEVLIEAFRKQAKVAALESTIDSETLESRTDYQELKRRLASIQAEIDELFDILDVEVPDLASVEDSRS